MVRDGTSVIKASGGNVIGSVNVPINNADYSSFILQADGSGADVIAFATAGGDTIGLIKQSAEFGLKQSWQDFCGAADHHERRRDRAGCPLPRD